MKMPIPIPRKGISTPFKGFGSGQQVGLSAKELNLLIKGHWRSSLRLRTWLPEDVPRTWTLFGQDAVWSRIVLGSDDVLRLIRHEL